MGNSIMNVKCRLESGIWLLVLFRYRIYEWVTVRVKIPIIKSYCCIIRDLHRQSFKSIFWSRIITSDRSIVVRKHKTHQIPAILCALLSSTHLNLVIQTDLITNATPTYCCLFKEHQNRNSLKCDPLSYWYSNRNIGISLNIRSEYILSTISPKSPYFTWYTIAVNSAMPMPHQIFIVVNTCLCLVKHTEVELRTQDNSYPSQLVPRTTRTHVVWYEMMCRDVMWCDVMWCDMIWCDIISYMMRCHTSCQTIFRTQDNSYPGQLVPMWFDMKWCDMIWCDVMWCDVMWYVN